MPPLAWPAARGQRSPDRRGHASRWPGGAMSRRRGYGNNLGDLGSRYSLLSALVHFGMRCGRSWDAGQGYVERLWWYPLPLAGCLESPPHADPIRRVTSAVVAGRPRPSAGRRERKTADGVPMSALTGESLELLQGPRPRARFQRLRVLTAARRLWSNRVRAMRHQPTGARRARVGLAASHSRMLPGWSGAGRAADARPMTATSLPPTTAVRRPTEGRSPGRRFLAALDDRRLALAAVGPNWFASVMGTSIVATAAGRPARRVPRLRAF